MKALSHREPPNPHGPPRTPMTTPSRTRSGFSRPAPTRRRAGRRQRPFTLSGPRKPCVAWIGAPATSRRGPFSAMPGGTARWPVPFPSSARPMAGPPRASSSGCVWGTPHAPRAHAGSRPLSAGPPPAWSAASSVASSCASPGAHVNGHLLAVLRGRGSRHWRSGCGRCRCGTGGGGGRRAVVSWRCPHRPRRRGRRRGRGAGASHGAMDSRGPLRPRALGSRRRLRGPLHRRRGGTGLRPHHAPAVGRDGCTARARAALRSCCHRCVLRPCGRGPDAGWGTSRRREPRCHRAFVRGLAGGPRAAGSSLRRAGSRPADPQRARGLRGPPLRLRARPRPDPAAAGGPLRGRLAL